jgi:hypothetical protein
MECRGGTTWRHISNCEHYKICINTTATTSTGNLCEERKTNYSTAMTCVYYLGHKFSWKLKLHCSILSYRLCHRISFRYGE